MYLLPLVSFSTVLGLSGDQIEIRRVSREHTIMLSKLCVLATQTPTRTSHYSQSTRLKTSDINLLAARELLCLCVLQDVDTD